MRLEYSARIIESIKKIDQFDLILLDLMMPGMSGYEVCEKIREKFLPSEMSVIIVTAQNQMGDLIQAFKTGANDYITKPFTKDEFLARVKTQLNLSNINKATWMFVPNDFIKALGRETITEVKLGDHIEKEVTVFFSDIRSYTTIAEKMSLSENFNFVQNHAAEMGPIIVKNKGFVSQYLGDSIMAIFNQDPRDALNAAIQMHHAIEVQNQKLAESRAGTEVGVGFHTGKLMMGIIGDDIHYQPVTIADTVNIASRIEGLTKYFGTRILLSEDSLKGIKNENSFDFRSLGKVQIKGKSKPIAIFECINGDSDAICSLKKVSIPLFSEAMQYYRNRDFVKAASGFQEILSKNKDDHPARLFLKKSADYISVEPPQDWVPIEIMDVK